MSCCIIKQNTSSSISELNKLNKYFDEIVLEQKEKYQLLTFRDKANRSNYDYIVWLSIKVSKGYKNGYFSKSDDEILSSVCKSILEWIDALLKYKKEDTLKQSSFDLFGDEQDVLEKLPEPPKEIDKYERYSKECSRINKKNAIEKYSFFELISIDYSTYKGIDYRKSLPNKEEIRELYKQGILKGKDKPGRYDEFWWDYPKNITETDGLSDIELVDRLNSIRLFLVPYKKHFSAFVDMSYTDHSSKTRDSYTDYRYYLDGARGLSTYCAHDYDTLELPLYDDIFNSEFLEWVRNTLKVPHKEVISDEDILKENLKHYFNSLLWHKRDKYCFEEKINSFKDWKQFKTNIVSFCKENALDLNGGGSGYSLDGFYGSYSLDRKGSITISQDYRARESINRDIDELEIEHNRYIVFHLSGDEIYKKAFELLSKRSDIVVQKSLFDFMAA